MGPKDREAVPLHYLEIIYPSPLRLKNAFDVCGGFIAVCCQVGDATYLDTKFPFMYLLVCDTITAVRVCTLQKMMQRINQQLYQEEYKLIGISILIFIFVVHSWPSLTWMSLFVDSPRVFCVLQASLLLSGIGQEGYGEEQSCCQLDFIQLWNTGSCGVCLQLQ